MTFLLHRLEKWIVDDILVGWTPAQIPNLSGKVAVVTGANSGIGFETSRKLAENGAMVYMVVRDMERGQRAVQAIKADVGPSVKLHLLQADFEHMSQVQALIAQLRGIRIDILVNNAGVWYPGPFRLTSDGLEQTLAINFFASALLTLGVLDQLAPGARVVFMSSPGEAPPFSKVERSFKNIRGDKFTGSGLVPYCTSKAYMVMFARELAARVQHRGIDVVAVQPGFVATPGHDKTDRTHYLSSWLFSFVGNHFGQTPYHGSWGTMYAATAPELRGKGFGFYGPTQAGFWHATERQPGLWLARSPKHCRRQFEETVKVLGEVLGKQLPPVPPPAQAAQHNGCGMGLKAAFAA